MTQTLPRFPSLSILLLLPLLAAAQAIVEDEDPFVSTCTNRFERDVLCNSINDRIDWTMKLQRKDLTYCPARCRTCKNYDYFDSNAADVFGRGFYSHDMNGTMYYDDGDGHRLKIHYDNYGNLYDEDRNPIHDQDGNWIFDPSLMHPTTPYEMRDFYESVHCARDFGRIQNIWKTGDNDRMYERILRDFPQYSPTVLSRPEDSDYASSRTAKDNPDVGVGPWLIQLENFLTEEECDEMIAQTKIAIEGDDTTWAGLANDTEATQMGGVCQSTQAWCDPDHCMNQEILQESWSKIEDLVDIPFATHTEPVHFIQYVPGQKYGSHTDAIPDEYDSMYGPRLFTILFYLNDVDDGNGGQTCFPKIERAYPDASNSTVFQEPICVQPKKGRAVIWPNILNEIPDDRVEIPDDRTWHEAHGITEGYKFASTVWYHLRNFSYAEDIGCTNIYTDGDDYIEYYDYDDFDDDGYAYEGEWGDSYNEEDEDSNSFVTSNYVDHDDESDELPVAYT